MYPVVLMCYYIFTEEVIFFIVYIIYEHDISYVKLFMNEMSFVIFFIEYERSAANTRILRYSPQKREETSQINNVNQLYNALHFQVMPKYTGHAAVFSYDFVDTQIIYF